MSRRRWWRTATIAAMVAIAVSGCAQSIPGYGEYSSGLGNAPDANIDIQGNPEKGADSVDTIAGNAIFDIQKFWTAQMPTVFDKKYEPVKAFYSIDPDSGEVPPCARSASDIKGNAFYCPSRDIVAWDRKYLFPALKEKFDSFLIGMVLAHEWGHAVQHRTRMPSQTRTIVVETQADCYAGAWTAYALKGNAPHFEITRTELDQALGGYLEFSDPVGTSANEQQAHGSGFDRVAAFQEGYEAFNQTGTVKHCTTFSDRRIFTEVPFQSQEDQQNSGNMEFGEALETGPKDLADYWDKNFSKVANGKQWKAPKIQSFDASGSDKPKCNGQDVATVQFCPSDDTVYFDNGSAMRKVYSDTGDFGPMTLIAVAYSTGVRKQLGRSVDGEQALLGAMCLAGTYARDDFDANRKIISLSPGDLDEAVRALLVFAGKQGFFQARGTVGFDRVAAFRRGFDDIRNCS